MWKLIPSLRSLFPYVYIRRREKWVVQFISNVPNMLFNYKQACALLVLAFVASIQALPVESENNGKSSPRHQFLYNFHTLTSTSSSCMRSQEAYDVRWRHQARYLCLVSVDLKKCLDWIFTLSFPEFQCYLGERNRSIVLWLMYSEIGFCEFPSIRSGIAI